MHAGVVAWNDKALIFPADSFSGKTTLVYEFVKKGAVYYSDEYAVLTVTAMCMPFPRIVSVRDEGGNYIKTDVSVESFGGIKGVDPKPVSLVLLTKYRRPGSLEPGDIDSRTGFDENDASGYFLEISLKVHNRSLEPNHKACHNRREFQKRR